MPALGDELRFAERPPLTDEVLAQHSAIDASLQHLSVRMLELAPNPKQRRWYHTDGVTSIGKKALYIPEDNPTVRMAAWLETVHWRRGAGLNPNKEHTSVEVNLMTQARAIRGSLAGKEARPIRRASASAGKLAIYLTSLSLLNCKDIDYESATNILTDIADTLTVIEEAGVLETNPTAGRLLSLNNHGYPGSELDAINIQGQSLDR